ncbi:MAG: aryl-sulfate sulfotransferase, partial [Candidatus Thiodiazotropha taylori]
MKPLMQSSKASFILALLITLLAGCGGGGSSSGESASDTTVEGSSQQGYTLYARLDSTTTYLMDNDGNPVHSWASDYRLGNAIYLLEDGSLLHTGDLENSRFDAGGAGGIVQTIDWHGNVTWEYTYSSTTHLQHHDVEMLPNGNLLMIAWQYKSEAQALQAGRDPALLSEGALWPDSIIEVEPNGSDSGTIVWQWHIWDHLIQDYDASRSNYGVVADHPELIDLNFAINSSADWTHINAVDYNAELDQILLTVHNFSEIWVIDHSTTTAEAAGHSGGASGKGGDLLYRWGNPQAYDAGTADEQMLFVPHDGEWIEAGYPGAGNII